jgi:two-component system chemotaxis sensor kinase CheA
VLDEVRAGRLSPGADALKVFFQSADHLSDLVRVSRDDESLPDAETEALLSSLGDLLDQDATGQVYATETEDIDFQPAMLSLDFDLDPDEDAAPGLRDLMVVAAGSATNKFCIKFKPQNELFETGNEPFHILCALAETGTCRVTRHVENIPNLNDLMAESSYLHWTVHLETEADEQEVSAVFEFVEGLCELDISEEGLSNSLSEGDEPQTQPISRPAPDAESRKASQDDDMVARTLEKHKAAPAAEPATQRTTAASGTAAEPASDASVAQSPAPAKSVFRVDLERIDRLVNLVGELVINQAMLSQSLERSGLSPHFDAMNGLEEFQRLTRDIKTA